VRLAALIACVALPALADEPALSRLIPLLEVYDADKPSPGFDVAGIRCAGLYAAQQDWSEKHGGSRPSRAQLADVEHNLTLAEQHRRNAGIPIPDARERTGKDVLRIVRLYTQRFASTGGDPPWRGDPLVEGDMTYCDLLGGR
jgi:hypothetical protein